MSERNRRANARAWVSDPVEHSEGEDMSGQETPRWSGEMLSSPEEVEAFAQQLRSGLAEYADFIARIRRDAEAMWESNPPAGYGSFEAWWRTRWVEAPLEDIQEHLEEAVKLTFRLSARYRRFTHDIPAARQAKQQRAQEQDQPALGSGRYGRRAPAPRPATQPAADRPLDGAGFMDIVRDQHGRRSA